MAPQIQFHQMYEDQEEEKTSITIFINIELQGVEREITYATFCNTTRLFTTGIFNDNQHYSYLESLLIQNNPKEQASTFDVHARIPAEWKSQKKKILEKFSEYNTKIHEQKLGKGQVQLPLTFLLKRPFNMYTRQLQNQKLRLVVQKIIDIIALQRDSSNKGQFDLRLINLNASMMLDRATISALQIFSKDMEKKLITTTTTTLYEIFNKCKTSFGNRCLKRWMKQPLQSKEEIQVRLDKVDFFITNPTIKNIIQNQLKQLPDLDRLYFVFYKVAAGKKVKCEVSDLIKIYRVVESLMKMVSNLEDRHISDPVIMQIYQTIKVNVNSIGKIKQMIEKGIDMSGQRDNQFFVRPQTQQSLQAIMKQKLQIQEDINNEVFKVAKHLNQEVQKIPSNTHKYVLEANKKNSINKVKETEGYKFLTAKQTKITFITSTLSKLCERLRMVDEEYQNQQQILLKKMFGLVAGYYPVMEELSYILSQLDVLTTIATVVISNSGSWCRPRIGEGLLGRDMRHPVVKNCIPNNCEMTSHKTIILTGPNMGGKSTYIRTIGVCTYLAHLGWYVPAVEFQTPVVDAIITRVGASDLQVKGISTFMSEMLQSSCMLETATKNSLVLIDQLGRGTSTSEGFGTAWAICEYLHTKIHPFCLFATHFHQMTRMSAQIQGVKNMYTTCKVQNGLLQLEYKVQQGKMQKSYGIQVMKMLNFPPEIIEVAQNYLQCYDCDDQADAVVNQLSDGVKNQISNLYSQMQETLSHNPVSSHEEIKNDYRLKMREVLSIQ